MAAGNGVLAVERGRDRYLQRLGKRDDFGLGAGCPHAAAGDDHRPLRACRMCERREHARLVGLRPERRHVGELRLAQRLHLRLLGVDLALVAAELQMHRARRAGDRDAECLAQHVGKPRDVVDGGVELGHRLERRHVVDLLIDLAELGARLAPAGHRDDRRMGEPGIAQAGREIERADHLGHADARLAGGARVTVGHVGGGFLAVDVEALDVGAALHLDEAAAQHGGHVKHVGDAVVPEHVGHTFGAEHLPSIMSKHVLVLELRRDGAWAGEVRAGRVAPRTPGDA